ncbi:A/G-specific adenine glycosylase [Olivibacter sitiensis]|uniref:A/G-specific adenine glycosylase n=1 Tax=Olivibacter sitiensis TaxID=376470 RepID=UPI0004854CF8|nr:A/G-specific adenine glycosylase [Olivibacter sitiensis]
MSFASEIIAWYCRNKRTLPWRDTSNPYIIWLSEIILQQTRVEQGLPYFQRFLENYPTVADFADASEASILRLWQGLGYYSRARNMHRAAKDVMEKHQGIFPIDYDSLIRLKGIGEYTAAAISSFSSNEARAVVDGNVFRVLARYFGISVPINSSEGKKIFYQVANELIDKDQAGLYNQAIMEFGALQCAPSRPNCAICPLQLDCYARKNDAVGLLPKKTKKKKSRDRYFNYLVITDQERILMNKRGPKDIWENLYEFPLLETDAPTDVQKLLTDPSFLELMEGPVQLTELSRPKKHILSHQNIYAVFYKLDSPINHKKNSSWNYVIKKDLDTLAKPKLIFTFLKDYFNKL